MDTKMKRGSMQMEEELPKILVNEHQKTNLVALSNPLSPKSPTQRMPKGVAEFNEQEKHREKLLIEKIPIISTKDCKDEQPIASKPISPKPSKKMNFLRSLSRKSFRRNKNSSNSSLSANSAMNDDSNHLQIPRMLRSSSVGYLSEVFYDVHNLCMIPAQVSDKQLEFLHPCEKRIITKDRETAKNPCLSCYHNILMAPSTNTNKSFTDRISRSLIRSAKRFPKHRSLSPHCQNKVAPLIEPSCSCNNVNGMQLNINPHGKNILQCENKDNVIANCNESLNERISKRKHYRKKRQCDLKNSNFYRNTAKKSSSLIFNDNVSGLQTPADRKRGVQCYASENSSIGDVSSASTASSSDTRGNARNLETNNKSGLFCRSSSLSQLSFNTDSSPLGVITPAVAKHKNYLFGGLGSLLGATELQRYFPDRSVSIFVATWNMNGKPSPASLDDFLLPDDMERMPDMFVIGTQESDSNLTEFEVMLQTTIGPSHVLFSSAAFGILHLTVFLRRDLVWFCSVPEEDSHGLRPGTYFKTKGAIAISFQFFGTRILLVNTHLFAHEEKLDQRIQNYKHIIHGIDLPKNLKNLKLIKSKDVTHRFDIVFWMGDLNFRLVGNREEILDIISLARTPDDFTDLLSHDQLTQTRSKGDAFNGFDEAAISFLPTFKFDVGTNRYDTSSKQRVPSFTDRILYRSTRDPINCIRYDSCPIIKTSDHKPVWGLYCFKVRPGKDDVPLAAGLFQRDIYLEALKRRRRLFHQPSSRSCQTQ